MAMTTPKRKPAKKMAKSKARTATRRTPAKRSTLTRKR